ncbi:hypothetical protein ACFVQ4_26460 [Streptomyces laurentii]|uniref:hypothetical protein n=1 Tax=Streptomyces laurentii TaxID=39478 RepID=UPI0036C0C705
MRELWRLARGGVLLTVWARALQLLRPDLVCSHRPRTAAALRRIELLRDPVAAEDAPAVLEFSSRRGSGKGGIRAHVTSRLTDGDCGQRRGLRVTTSARTVGDLTRAAGGRAAAVVVVVADSALSRRQVGDAGLRPGTQPAPRTVAGLVLHPDFTAREAFDHPGRMTATVRTALAALA